MAKNNLYKKITDQIIQALENGEFAKWVQPWNNGLPYNAFSGHRYRGINQLILGIKSYVKGYDDPRWITFKQANKKGGKVKKGEKSTLIVFWKFIEMPEDDNPELPEEEQTVKVVPIARAYRVFNVAQCEGLKLRPLEKNYYDLDTFTEQLLALPEIQWGGTMACYVPSEDIIRLPQKENFIHAEGFKEVFYHELVHWTAHEDRLARDLKGRFGDARYAMEELVAELGSAFLMAHIGVPLTQTQHTAYLDSWLEVFRKDNRAIFTAARRAQDACDFLLKSAGLAKHEQGLKKAA